MSESRRFAELPGKKWHVFYKQQYGLNKAGQKWDTMDGLDITIIKQQLTVNWISHKRILGVSLIEFCLMLVVATMPYSNNLNSYSIVLFCVVAFFSNSLKEKIQILRQHISLWIFPVGYFFWMLFSLLWDKGHIDSVFKQETYSALIVFPIIIGSMAKLPRESIRKVLMTFVLTVLIASFYCLYASYQVYETNNYINVFYYHNLSEHIGLNAIFFSMYCVFSMLTLLFYFLFNKYSNRWVQFIALTGVAYLILFTVLLSSKMFIFLLYMIAVSITIYSYYYFSKVRLGSIIMLITLIAIPFLLLKFPYVYSRIEETKVQKYRGTIDDQNGVAVRGVLWKSSWSIIKQKPVLGWGRYGSSGELTKLYAAAGFKEGVINNYNSHNQYLYTWACYGIIGLIIMLCFLGRALGHLFSKRHFLGIYLVCLFILANLTECMMEAQHGIVFFLFFTSLFLYHSNGAKKPAHNQQ